tara:strand:+ start:4234 stop:4377 length:144 start_codon:yes stop_codon:yes gene_type:complete
LSGSIFHFSNLFFTGFSVDLSFFQDYPNFSNEIFFDGSDEIIEESLG